MEIRKDNVLIECKRNGITDETDYNVVIESTNGIRICHSTFAYLSQATELRKKLISNAED